MKLQDFIDLDFRWFYLLVDNEIPALQDMGELELLADYSDGDSYQGDVRVAFLDRDGRCCYIEYSYGSCSHCDPFEDMDADDVRNDIFQTMVVLEKSEFVKFAASHRYLKQGLDHLVSHLFN